MAIVTIDEIKEFANIYPDSDDAVTMIVDAAQSIVFEYLGYSPIIEDRVDTIQGLGDDSLYLKAFPLVGTVTIDGVEQPFFDADRNILVLDAFYFEYGRRYQVAYQAGYEEAYIPAIIKHTIVRIASILLQETNGNIGVTGKSDNNSGSRTFINYTNFSKYLDPLKAHRLQKALV